VSKPFESSPTPGYSASSASSAIASPFNGLARITKSLAVLAIGGLASIGFGVFAPAASAQQSQSTLFSSTPPTLPTPPTSPTSPAQTVTGVKLASLRAAGPKHTYEATVSDTDGLPVDGAELDLGGLQADPDIRVPTTAMIPSGVSGSYRATIEFPSDGEWMLVVRVHTPTQAVELFTETVVGAGVLPSHVDAASTPSRRALRAADPSFAARYNPAAGEASGPTSQDLTATHSSTNTVLDQATGHRATAESTQGLDVSNTIVVLAHSAAAGAWLLAVLGLVFANRVSPETAKNAVFQFVAHRYTHLAGGGLATVTVTGLIVSLKASAGLAHPKQLAATNLGIAYLAVFGLKLVLVAGGILTSWRIGTLLPTSRQFVLRNRLASAGAMANEDPAAIPNVRTIFRLAETNLILAVSIIGCVGILGQLHHAIH
jgi:hypothetical protein